MIKNIKKLSIITASILLVGCGGGGSSSSTSTKTSKTNAQLIDAPIVGAKYVNEDGTSGKTVSNGEFNYTGGKVSFYIGNIKIGELASITDDNKVFLQDILKLDRANKDDSKLLNHARFLQSLDTDDTTDSIEIGDNFDKFMGDSYKTDLADLDIVSALNEQNITLKELDDVKTHLENSIKQYVKADEDTQKPFVQKSFPSNNESDVLVNEDIIVEFSENISKDSLLKSNIVLKDASSNNVAIKKRVVGNKLIISPSSNLKNDTSYHLAIDKELKDYAGNSLNQGETLSFKTKSSIDTSAPVILKSVPNDNASEFKLSEKLVITFSEKMNEETINSSNISLRKKDENKNLDINVKYEDKILSISSVKTLDANTAYTLTLGSGLKDASNNALNEQTINFTTSNELSFNGYNYKVVRSPISGKYWLDRNLGAQKVCEDKDDTACYGDYYQWGRKTNGHEKKDSIIFDASLNPLKKDVLSNGKFATWRDDWRENKNDELWTGVNATNAICPSGYKVPSIDEILIETKNVNDLQFPNQKVDGQYTNLTNFLKLPSSGFRSKGNPPVFAAGALYLRGYKGEVWTNTVSPSTNMAYTFDYFPGGSSASLSVKANGYGVRCMKDYTDTVLPEVVSTTPANNATNVPLDTEFRVEFSKPFITSPSRDNIILLKGNQQVRLNILRNISNHSLVISLDGFQGDEGTGLSYDTEYKLIFKKDLYDVSGNHLAEDKVITFRTTKTLENTPVTISKTYPKANASDTVRNENLRIYFTKALKESTISGNIVLKEGSNVIPTTLTYKNRVVTVNPSTSLSENTTYTLEVQTGLQDINNLNVEALNTISFTTGSLELTEDKYGNIYREITSAKTGKVWLDRNLGAIKVCEYLNDKDCYGDHFQWGRKANGHEKADAPTSATKIASDVDSNGKFITASTFSDETKWSTQTDSSLISLWNHDGANNVCPSGFKLPSKEELENELEGFTRTNLFDNFLKLSNNGRKSKNASIDGSSFTYLWSNTTAGSAYGKAKALKIETLNAVIEDENHNSGLAIRCIKN